LKNYRTPLESLALLPVATERLSALADVAHEVRSAREGGPSVDRRAARTEAEQMLAWFKSRCLKVQSLEPGQVDIPALRWGKEVVLCWKVGESSVAHWHGPDEPCSERQPVMDSDSPWYHSH